MKLIKDTVAQFSIGVLVQLVIVIILVGLLGLVGIYIDEKIADKTQLTDLAAASNTISFTGNVSQNETVNITINTPVASSVYCFAYNLTSVTGQTYFGIGGSCTTIQLSLANNQSDRAFSNLTNAINNNATLSAVITATNGTNATSITFDVLGTSGNSNGTYAESLTNGAWSSTSLSGGTDRDTFFNSSGDAVDTVETGFDFLEILVLAIVAGLVILAIFSYLPIKL